MFAVGHILFLNFFCFKCFYNLLFSLLDDGYGPSFAVHAPKNAVVQFGYKIGLVGSGSGKD